MTRCLLDRCNFSRDGWKETEKAHAMDEILVNKVVLKYSQTLRKPYSE